MWGRQGWCVRSWQVCRIGSSGGRQHEHQRQQQQQRRRLAASVCLMCTPCSLPSLAESEAARQHLLAGCLLLLGAPLPSALPSNSPAAAAAAAAGDELWLGAAATGCQPGSSAGGCRWAAELLAQGDWGWLVGAGGVPAPPRSLQQQPWYRGDATRLAALEQLLKALMRGPCRQDGGLAAALLAVAAEQEAAGGAAAAGRKPYEHARGLARQLLAEQRTNLVLWQVGEGREGLGGSAWQQVRGAAVCEKQP